MGPMSPRSVLAQELCTFCVVRGAFSQFIAASSKGHFRLCTMEDGRMIISSPTCCLPKACDFLMRLQTLGVQSPSFCIVISSKQKGPGEKGAPRNHPEIRLRNWPISSTDFPMTPMEGTEHHFVGPFQEKDFGAISGGPSSPSPFCLLLYCQSPP